VFDYIQNKCVDLCICQTVVLMVGISLIIIFKRYISFSEVHIVQHTVPISWRDDGLCNTVIKATWLIGRHKRKYTNSFFIILGICRWTRALPW